MMARRWLEKMLMTAAMIEDAQEEQEDRVEASPEAQPEPKVPRVRSRNVAQP